MSKMKTIPHTCVLTRSFYQRNPLLVAKNLLGKTLVRSVREKIMTGKIVEVEAYIGPEDKASHAYRNLRTDRTMLQFGERGLAYVYTVYGVNHCFCVVAGRDHIPAVCLIRAVEPLLGLETMRTNRQAPSTLSLTNGPSKLCQAFAIDQRYYGTDLCTRGPLYIAEGDSIPKGLIGTSGRIGIDYAEESKDHPWRYFLRGNKFVSGTC